MALPAAWYRDLAVALRLRPTDAMSLLARR
jgi:hypothetical protein